MLAADQSDIDKIMEGVEREARASATATGSQGVASRATLTAGRAVMQAVVNEIERRTPPMDAALGLAPLFASAISTLFVNTNLADDGPQLRYALDLTVRRIVEQTLAHMAAARAGKGERDFVALRPAGRA